MAEFSPAAVREKRSGDSSSCAIKASSFKAYLQPPSHAATAAMATLLREGEEQEAREIGRHTCNHNI